MLQVFIRPNVILPKSGLKKMLALMQFLLTEEVVFLQIQQQIVGEMVLLMRNPVNGTQQTKPVFNAMVKKELSF
jgi:hypothetical protein